jgi:serine/threonine protein kinase
MPTAHYCPRCLTTFAEVGPRCPNLGCGAPAPDEGWPTLLGPGDVLDRTYHVLDRLAGGAAGMTYLAQELDADGALTGPHLAIKVLYQQRDSGPFLRRLATEAQILQELAHPHIVECLGFVHRAGRPPYLVTRFEAGGTLHGHVARCGPLHPAVAASIVSQILDALEVAHRADIVHRDLKPGNILLRAEVPPHEVPTVLLADFGVARITGSLGGMTRIGTFVGTPEFAAPEQFLGVEPTGKADLFAAGAVLWFCVTGEAPIRFSHRNDPGQCHDELIAVLPPPLPPALRDTGPGRLLQAVIDGLLLPDPAHRWDTGRAREALRDVIRRTRGEQFRMPDSPTAANPSSAFEDPHGTFLWEEQDAAPDLGVGGTLFAAPTRRRSRAEPAAPPPPTGPVSSMEGLFDFADDPPAPAPAAPGRAEDAAFDEEVARPGRPAPDPRPARTAAPPTTPRTAAIPEPAASGSRGAAADPFDAAAPAVPFGAPAARSPAAPPPPAPATPDPRRAPTGPPSLLDAEPLRPDADDREEDPFEAFFDAPMTPRRALAALGARPHADALAAVRGLDERALADALRQARADDDPTVRRGAAIAAGELGRAEQTSLLRALLRDPVVAVRASATHALGLIAQGSGCCSKTPILRSAPPRRSPSPTPTPATATCAAAASSSPASAPTAIRSSGRRSPRR